jgi:hypothetical protein
VRILGPEYASCHRLEQELTAVLVGMDMLADLQPVTDIEEIASYVVMGT